MGGSGVHEGTGVKDPATPLWRGAVVLRLFILVFAVPDLDWSVLAWSLCTAFAYCVPWGRRKPFVLVDVLVVCLLTLLSPLEMPEALLWASVPALTASVVGGQSWGLGAAAAIAASTLAAEGTLSVGLVRDFVLLAGTTVLVALVAHARRTAVRLEEALRAEAANAERERLARSIHDGVLQVLARIHKRGLEIGGDAAELATLAGEQEVALRTLVAAPARTTANGEVDLVPGLRVLATPQVQVSTPGTPVMLAAAVADKLVSRVRETLAGVRGRAWVLLEDLGDEVVISIRDDGDAEREVRARRKGAVA